MNFIGLIFKMLVKGNAQDVPNDKETVADTERNLGGGGGVLEARRAEWGGYGRYGRYVRSLPEKMLNK